MAPTADGAWLVFTLDDWREFARDWLMALPAMHSTLVRREDDPRGNHLQLAGGARVVHLPAPVLLVVLARLGETGLATLMIPGDYIDDLPVYLVTPDATTAHQWMAELHLAGYARSVFASAKPRGASRPEKPISERGRQLEEED